MEIIGYSISGLECFLSMLASSLAIYSWYQDYRRRKIQNVLKSTLQNTAGNIAKIRQSTMWSFNNFREAQSIAANLSTPDIELIRKISDGQGDAAAADRMVVNLFNEILSVQQGQFGTRIVVHPEARELDLVIKNNSKDE